MPHQAIFNERVIGALITEELEKNYEIILDHLRTVRQASKKPEPASLPPQTVKDSIKFLADYFRSSANRQANPKQYSEFYKVLKIGIEKQLLGELDESILKAVIEHKKSSSTNISDSHARNMSAKLDRSQDDSNDRASKRSIKSANQTDQLQQRIRFKLQMLEQQKDQQQTVGSSRKTDSLQTSQVNKSQMHEQKHTEIFLPQVKQTPAEASVVTNTTAGPISKKVAPQDRLRKLLRTRGDEQAKPRERKRCEPLPNSYFSVIDQCRSLSLEKSTALHTSHRSLDKIVKGEHYSKILE